MRVLWFTNVPLTQAGPEFGAKAAGSGGWMSGLADAMQQYNPISLGVVSACCDGKDTVLVAKGICHYRIAVPHRQYTRVTQLTVDKKFIQSCQGVVSTFKPDMIHIHGTEQTFGLLSAEGILGAPSIISLQGLIGAIFPRYFGDMTPSEVMACHSIPNMILRQGLLFDWLHWKRRPAVERRILEGNRHFIGRTLFDKAQLHMVNPQANYHACNELLRPEFYNPEISLGKAGCPTIFAVWGGYPIKGTHVLLRAISRVREFLPNIKVRLAGGAFKRSRLLRGYGSYLDDLIHDQNLSDSIVLLPGLDAAQFAQELQAATGFVLPSFIENSPNSLCEAMLMGTPCITSFVGGVPSLVTDNETALCFPAGEHAVLAEQLIRVLTDPALAKRISTNAREVAWKRHDRQSVANTMFEIYQKVMKKPCSA